MQGEERNIPINLAQREEKSGDNSKKGKEKNNTTVELANGLDPHVRA
jgi:hypothetical protein